MALKIEEIFRVEAPAARVWEFLVDPQQVVQCLPGAELVETQDANTFLGRVKVKVGPVTASYSGKATFVERDDEQRRVRMVGEGRETSGAGSAKMTMTSEVVALADGATEVRVSAELDVVGRIVQFGRGMIEEVNRQLFRQFAECTRARLEDAGPAATESAAAAGEPGAASAPAGAAPIAATSPSPVPAHGPSEPVRAMPLLFRAAGAMLRRFFSRLFRRGPASPPAS